MFLYSQAMKILSKSKLVKKAALLSMLYNLICILMKKKQMVLLKYCKSVKYN